MTTPNLALPILDIESYYIDELVFRAFDEHDSAREQSGTLHVDMDVQRAEDSPRDYRILMTIKLNEDGYSADANPPYAISLRIAGYFTFREDAEDTDQERMIRLNGSSILYGVARGLVGQASGASRHGQFVLPTFNFVAYWKAKADKAAAELQAVGEGAEEH